MQAVKPPEPLPVMAATEAAAKVKRHIIIHTWIERFRVYIYVWIYMDIGICIAIADMAPTEAPAKVRWILFYLCVYICVIVYVCVSCIYVICIRGISVFHLDHLVMTFCASSCALYYLNYGFMHVCISTCVFIFVYMWILFVSVFHPSHLNLWLFDPLCALSNTICFTILCAICDASIGGSCGIHKGGRTQAGTRLSIDRCRDIDKI